MEVTCPIVTANSREDHLPFPTAVQTPVIAIKWLLELEGDGTIRYSHGYPYSATADGTETVIGANLFELPNVGELNEFKRDFRGFVKGVKNRQTFRVSGGSASRDAVVVLTKTFDTTKTGPEGEVILMELKSI